MLLSSLFGSEGREQVLQFILARGSGYGREIARFFNVNPSAIQKQLDVLEADEILKSQSIGTSRVYQFNPRYYLFEELKSLLLKARTAYEPTMIEELVANRKRPRRKGKPL
jgi:predicted transcriptional regulator